MQRDAQTLTDVYFLQETQKTTVWLTTYCPEHFMLGSDFFNLICFCPLVALMWHKIICLLKQFHQIISLFTHLFVWTPKYSLKKNTHINLVCFKNWTVLTRMRNTNNSTYILENFTSDSQKPTTVTHNLHKINDLQKEIHPPPPCCVTHFHL